MHNWNSSWPYFGDVEEAASYIGDFLRRWGRVPVRQTKEKFGEVRVYCSFGWYSMHDLTHPGWAFYQYKGIWYELFFKTLKIQQSIFALLNYIVIPYHQGLYRLAHKRACKKWPHIKKEILGAPDWDELLEGL